METDLGCNVIRSPAEGSRGRALVHPLLAHAEVGQLAVAVLVQEDVVQFEIPAKGGQRMGAAQAHHHRAVLSFRVDKMG